jgi:HD-like signal output (HDOD) protein
MPNPIPSSLDRLLTAIRRNGEFPAMARTVSQIGDLTSSEATSSSELADTILQDYGLTQKVLRLVNTANFAQYDEVTTITRAVLLMGFERIRGIATGLLLFEHLQQQGGKGRLADALTMSFYGAMLGRTIAEASGFADGEETFIGALFHRLGQILVAFYLPEAQVRIDAAAGQAGTKEHAVQEVLGTSFEALGVAVAEELRLPGKLVQAMVRISGESANRGLAAGQRLACLATLANDVTDVLASSETGPDKRAAIVRLLESYASLFSVGTTVDELVALALKRLKESSATLNLDLPGSRFVAGLAEWAAPPAVAAPARFAAAETSSAGTLVSEVDEGAEAPAAELPETVLTRGLHEITSLLVGEYAMDDVLRVTLETIYRALGVGHTRVFFLLKDPAAPVARFRFGFGQAITEMKAWFEVPIQGAEDLFSLAFTDQKDIVIRDPASPDVMRALPAWYTGLGVFDRYLVLLPLVVDQRTVGLFYVDGDRERLGVLTPAVVNYLKVLRGQAALAIRQKANRLGRR